MRANLLALSLFSSLAQAAGSGGYEVLERWTLGGSGGWDYLAVDAPAHRLFVSRSDRVLVVDTRDGTLLATIPDTQGVHGIALVPDLGRGFSSNGGADSVTAFDLKSLQPVGTIEVGGRNPDAILYDRSSRQLYTFNGRSQDISVIDPVHAALITRIPAGGKPEFAVSDGAGRIFFNIEDKTQLGAIDASANQLLAAWPLTHCEDPSGLAFDVAHHRLFSVCGNGLMVVTDASTGSHVAEVPIGKGPDAAAFDPERGLIFSSNGQDGTLTIVHEDDPDHYRVVGNVATQKSARTMALDTTTHRVYLVAAQFGPAPAPSAELPRPRPSVLDGSFTVLVVGDPPPGNKASTASP